ncbi:MAG: tetratricopeptide repeat protein [Candidatus Sulfomarinibacteraceae bacterium]
MSRNVVIVTALVAVFLAGGLSPARGQATVTGQEVLAGKLLGVTGDPTTSIEASEVLALNDQMRAFLKKNVNPGGTDVFRLQQLTDAIMGKTHIRLEYDENTRTAAETFRLQRGNCLSFTTMFVALARGAGLKADFQEVDIPPDWTTRRDVFVLNRHVNIIVDVGAAGTRAVDFNIGDFKTTYDVEKISDKRAIAHFFNNMGVERMQEGDIVDAVAFYRRAIEESGNDFSPAWTNLGMLYRKHGHLEHAEVAYLQALEADKEDTVAMSNLVSLYEEMGDREKAERYQKRVDKHRLHNPHLRFSLALEAFSNGEIDTAIGHLKYAIRKVDDEGKYYYLLGVCHLVKGDEQKARRWLAKAERVAATDEERQKYSTDFEALVLLSRERD